MKNLVTTISKNYVLVGQRLGAMFNAPSRMHLQAMLFVLGFVILLVGIRSNADAYGGGWTGHTTTYNDSRLNNAMNAILTYIEGSFGALIMVAAGIGAIVSSAFGQYRAALGLLVVAVGSFILRSLISTFFNDRGIMQ